MATGQGTIQGVGSTQKQCTINNITTLPTPLTPAMPAQINYKKNGHSPISLDIWNFDITGDGSDGSPYVAKLTSLAGK